MEERVMVRAGVPPPPSEVKVRTMRSDLESMAKSGGGMPRFQDVEVSNLSIEKEYTTPGHSPNLVVPAAVAHAPDAASPQGAVGAEQPAAHKKDVYPIVIVALVAILAIGGVGYFAYITFFTGPAAPPSSTTTQASTSTLPAAAAASSTPAAPTASSSPAASVTPLPAASQTATLSAADELPSPHVSLFEKPADQVITVDLSGVTAATYQKIMLSSLTLVDPAASMIEIAPTANDGANISIQGLFAVAGASVLNQAALASLNADATFFVYRDKDGLWPGYVIALDAGQTSSSIAADVAQLEQSTSIGNLFLTNPGTPSSDGFTDSMTANIPVRVLPFSGVSFPLYFSYGWDGNNLILSTSNNGFAAAVAALQ